MKKNRKRLFSISKKEGESIGNNREYIDLVDCPQGGKSCEEHRKVINKSMLASRQHLFNNNYPLTFKELKTAFYKTSELKKVQCFSCAKLFRTSIIRSMENIHNDMEKTSYSFFSGKKLSPNYILATKVLNEFKNNLD